jgi:hypothetical protein
MNWRSLLLNIISLIPHNLMIKYKLRKLHPMLKQKSSRCPYRQASQVTAFIWALLGWEALLEALWKAAQVALWAALVVMGI